MTTAEPRKRTRAPAVKKKDPMSMQLDLRGPTAQALINRMTNWQRKQWQHAGRPQTHRALVLYTKLDHWKKGTVVEHGTKA